MKKILITGGTGSGKTYQAIKMAENMGSPYAYLAPTALLAMECYVNYGTLQDSLEAKGVNLKGEGIGNDFYGLYANKRNYNANYGTIIIDEAHFAFNFPEHLKNVQDIIENFNGNIILVTATKDFKTPQGFKEINLESKVNFKKKEIEEKQALQRMKEGIPTLILCQTIRELEETTEDLREQNINFASLDRYTSTKGILKALKSFKTGDITCIVATNIAAQGINIACENLIIYDDNRYSDNSLIQQKLGRLGRLSHTKKDAELTFCNLAFTPVQAEEFNDFSIKINDNDFEQGEDYNPPVYKQKQIGKIISLLHDLRKASQ